MVRYALSLKRLLSLPAHTSECLLASNPGPHHFDLLDLREEGLGKLPAILEIVRSMDRFDRSFHRFSL